jgi:hypothetical protein
MRSTGPKPLNSDRKLEPLRRTITPYRGQIVIYSVITILSLFVAHRSPQWPFAWTLIVIWAGLAVSVYFGLRYSVLWDGTGVVMRASRVERHIRYDEITEIKVETAPAQSRPFRRIVVHGDRRDPNAFVDISLRHFRPSDIDELLAVIRTRRPDLLVPAIPWGTGSL